MIGLLAQKGMRRPETAQIISVLVPLVFALLISGTISKALESRNWPSVAGTVVESRVDPSSGRGRQILIYRYEVHGVTYESSNYDATGSLGPIARKLPWIGNELDRYRPGEAIRIYYLSIKPSEALLEPGLSSRCKSALLAFFLVSLVCCGAFLGASRSYRLWINKRQRKRSRR